MTRNTLEKEALADKKLNLRWQIENVPGPRTRGIFGGIEGPPWPSGKIWELEAPVSKPDSIEYPPCLGAWCTLNLTWVKRTPAGVVQKYPHWPGLPKKGVRLGKNLRGENRPTSMWRTGFVRCNKMIQALPEQGQSIQESWECKHGSTHFGGERIA
ncbi:hypothetical protein AVEN_65078-1 [Araneus ventricosus]|uniref:Uncharacterized protein n=1 Tax=Araneus ventricosus TaxID=182803 RepID=A0A4Y2F8G8_ARAVE|nr:hypothetical protein AVEN_65078-1 [Araneus ventricosus]